MFIGTPMDFNLLWIYFITNKGETTTMSYMKNDLMERLQADSMKSHKDFRDGLTEEELDLYNAGYDDAIADTLDAAIKLVESLTYYNDKKGIYDAENPDSKLYGNHDHMIPRAYAVEALTHLFEHDLFRHVWTEQEKAEAALYLKSIA
jgi:hypothetical protein